MLIQYYGVRRNDPDSLQVSQSDAGQQRGPVTTCHDSPRPYILADLNKVQQFV